MRVLVLTHRLPYAPNRGDRLRVYHMLHHLRRHAEIELVSLVHDDEEASHADEVRAFIPRVSVHRVGRVRNAINAAGALIGGRPLTHALLDAGGMSSTLQEIARTRRPDVVFAYCSGMARFAMQAPLDDVPMVLDFVDVDSGKWRDLAAGSAPPLSWIYRREAATLGAFEAAAATRAVTAIVVNAREADAAKALAPEANVQVISNGVEVGRLTPTTPPSSQPRVVFCGVMNYAPNAEGMMWFVQRVWPLVRARRSDATLAVVGPDASPAFRSICGRDPSITVAGRVADVRDWLWASAIGIAPLHVARGVQNKALEAMAAGLPVVMTEAVACGLPYEAAPASRVANVPARFAEHILDLLARSPEERRRMAQSADLGALTWSRTLQPLWPIIERASRVTGSADRRAEASVPARVNGRLREMRS